ncbi:hypothetical protein NDU88_005922 [Pleurodeles waltl]|uniref:Uncharacterized protein n=1 Tax=Pleurodeles waltl TaxID=8319 RepID=A0AAV7UKN6_PLEWA|nr:hypothetical protein NDU88_005922 [Pleurodeles waltl]
MLCGERRRQTAVKKDDVTKKEENCEKEDVTNKEDEEKRGTFSAVAREKGHQPVTKPLQPQAIAGNMFFLVECGVWFTRCVWDKHALLVALQHFLRGLLVKGLALCSRVPGLSEK